MYKVAFPPPWGDRIKLLGKKSSGEEGKRKTKERGEKGREGKEKGRREGEGKGE